MKILIIEDEKNLALAIKKGLEDHAFTAEISFDGEEGLYMAEAYEFDAVLLDIMLPKLDGFEVLKRLREKRISTPVLMLTARGEVEDRIRGLDRGADDYIAKPFDFKELLARLRAVLRRHKGRASSVLSIGGLELDMNTHAVIRGGKKIKLSAKEYKILEYLVLNRDRIISRTELIEHVYDSDSDLDSNVIDVYINYLRKKIDRGFPYRLIHTVRGAGYIMKNDS